MKRYISLFLLFLQTLFLVAQQINFVPDITERYWNYRYHLIGDDIDPSYWEAGLLQLGDCDGCSLPANEAVIRCSEFIIPNSYLKFCRLTNPVMRLPNFKFGRADISALPAGLYFAVIQNEKERAVRRFVKE